MSEKKSSAEELETASRFFQLLAETSKSVFWARDTKLSKQLYLSPAYETIWGRPRQELFDDPDSWINTLHPEDREARTSDRMVSTHQNEGAQARYESIFRIIRPDGEIRWIKDSSFPIYNNDHQFIGYAGISEDITNEKLLEDVLKKAKEKAEAASQAKSDFLAVISHELRTPLNAILGMAQVIEEKHNNPEIDDMANAIFQSGNHLLSLINEILDFAKIQSGKLEISQTPFDIKQLTESIITSLSPNAANKNIELLIEYNDEVPHQLIGDPQRLRQIITNLVGNAIKFTDKGHVLIAVDFIETHQDEIQLQISVEDTGIGIPKDRIQTVFEQFTQIDSSYERKYQGTGLGLAITEQLVEIMGGIIGVNSQAGKGSTFWFNLKFKIANAIETTLEQSPRINVESAIGQRILVVEDNLLNQKVIALLLQDLKCQVDLASNGAEAIEKFDDNYDLVFMDIGLPDQNGLDITKILRQTNTDTPIIALTAHVLESDRTKCLAAGMNDVLTKPILKDELYLVLEKWCVRHPVA